MRYRHQKHGDQAPPAFTGGRGLKQVGGGFGCQAIHRTARLHRRARIETFGCSVGRMLMGAPPAFTGGRGLKLDYFQSIDRSRKAPPAFTGGRGLKLHARNLLL